MPTKLEKPNPSTKKVYTSGVSLHEKVKIILDFCAAGQELTR